MSKFAAQNGFIAWFETSAKNNTNIDTAFNTLISHIVKLTRTMNLSAPQSNNSNQLNVVGSNAKKSLPYKEYSDNNEEEETQQANNSGRSGCCG